MVNIDFYLVVLVICLLFPTVLFGNTLVNTAANGRAGSAEPKKEPGKP